MNLARLIIPYIMKTLKGYALVTAATLTGAQSQTLNSAFFSDSDITIYEESSPGVLTANSSYDPVLAMQGSANAAGGNVELFASSDSPSYDDASATGAFAMANPTVLTAGFSDSSSVTVSGLNGQDWFVDSGSVYDTAYGADNLANQWFGDFLSAMNSQSSGAANAFIVGNEGTLFDSFRDNGGFAQMSDPNISYIDTSDSFVSVGLGGFEDATPRVAGLLDVSTFILGQFFPNGIEISEVVKVNDQEVYSFAAVNSGVVLNDGVDSYSATYVVSVPEPSSSVLLLLAGLAGISRRKR